MDTSRTGDGELGERATRRLRTLEEKVRIVEEASRPGASVAAVARKHGLNANLLFGWRRLHRRGLLEGQRHVPPLLPVRITSPTITPTRRASAAAAASRRRGARPAAMTAESFIEIIVAVVILVRLHGQGQRVLPLPLLY